MSYSSERYRLQRATRLAAVAHLSQPCLTCGAPARVCANGKPIKYCNSCGSRTCACGSPKAWKTKHCLDCEKKRRSKRTCICRHCQKVYLPKVANRNRYCSRKCANDDSWRRIDYSRKSSSRPSCVVYFPTCKQCRKQFAAQQNTTCLCSEMCRKAEQLAFRMGTHAGERTCKTCSSVFAVEYGDHARFCSDVCKEIARRDVRRKSRKHGSKGQDKHRKRARYHGVEYEPIRLAKVLDRDGWRCGICRKPISKTAKYPNPMMPSLDHIIPMSKGGPHLYTNVQAAHHICNTLKRDSNKGEQLLLVG